MSTFYAQYPVTGGVGGIATYPTFSAFPPTASNGAVAVDLATDNIYVFDAGTSTWVLVAGPGIAGLVTGATPNNTPNTLVKRDALGNFAAGTITADLTGNATTAGTAGNVTGTVAIVNGGTGQTTAPLAIAALGGVSTSQIGAANGVAPLDGSTKIPVAYLPSAVMEYQQAWDSSTNTPSLSDGTGTNGFTYRVSVASVGPLAGLTDPSMTDFHVGDFVIYSGSLAKWQRSPAADGVTSVNGMQGAVSLALGDLTNVAVPTPNVNDQLTWNGADWVNTTPNQGQGIGVVYYPSGTASDISGYRVMDVSPDVGSEIIETVAVDSGITPVLIRAFASPPVGLGVTSINAGDWIMSNWGTVSAGATCNLQFDIYKRTSGGVETLLFTLTSDTLTTAVLEQDTESVEGAFACNLTDRLVLKVSATNSSATSRNVSFYYDGTQHYSHLHTSLNLLHNQLGGLQGGAAGEYYHLDLAHYNLVQGATSSDTPLTLVERDASGNFSAGTITATLTGAATSAGTAVNFSGSLSGDVTGGQSSTSVVKVNGASVPVSATVVGTNSSGQIVSQTGTIANNTSGTAGNVTGIVAINNGGTGQNNKANAFNALQPMTAIGQIIGGGTGGVAVVIPPNPSTTKYWLRSSGDGTTAFLPTWDTISGSDIFGNIAGNAANVTGTVAVANGGTGVDTASANTVFAGPTTGSAAAPAFRALVVNDLPFNYLESSTWVPTVSFAGGSGWSIVTDHAVYSRIGKMVFIDASFTVTKGSGTGAMTLGGLPLASNSDTNYRSLAAVRQVQTAGPWFISIGVGTNSFQVITSEGGTAAAAADLGTTAAFWFQTMYRIA